MRYAIAAGINKDLDRSSLFGDAFSLGCADESLPVDIIPADVLVVPESIDAHEKLDEVVGRLAGFSKPKASVILATTSKAAAPLKAKGFNPVFSANGVALYRKQPDRIDNVNGETPRRRDFMIIEPSAPSNTVKSFSSFLQIALREQCHESVTMTWANLNIERGENTAGKMIISLVELETPLLANLSEPDFNKVKQLVLNSERILWLTGGHDPSMAAVDGLSRTARNENAGLKFQVLHLLSSLDAAIGHGPALAARLATSSTQDDEFREYNGLLKTSRIFNNDAGNRAVRSCLKDSVQIQPLKNHSAHAALRLTIGKPGLLDTLAFIHDERFGASLGEMDIEVDIQATGVK